MSLKTDLTISTYTFGKTEVDIDGTAKVQVRLYSPDGSQITKRWIDLNLSQAAKDVIIAKRDSILSTLASDNGITER